MRRPPFCGVRMLFTVLRRISTGGLLSLLNMCTITFGDMLVKEVRPDQAMRPRATARVAPTSAVIVGAALAVALEMYILELVYSLICARKSLTTWVSIWACSAYASTLPLWRSYICCSRLCLAGSMPLGEDWLIS